MFDILIISVANYSSKKSRKITINYPKLIRSLFCSVFFSSFSFSLIRTHLRNVNQAYIPRCYFYLSIYYDSRSYYNLLYAQSFYLWNSSDFLEFLQCSIQLYLLNMFYTSHKAVQLEKFRLLETIKFYSLFQSLYNLG